MESCAIDGDADGAGTVGAFQTEPASYFNACTGKSCTYPVQLCRTCHCAVDEPPAEREQQE